MTGVWGNLRDAIDRSGAVAMITIVATRGSSPRDAGARLIVHADGAFTGSVGGGTLEWRAIAIAQAALSDPAGPRAFVRRFALGPELGQCCGGEVHLLFEVRGRDDRGEVAELAEREQAGPFATRGAWSERGVARTVVGELAPAGTAEMEGNALTEGFGDERRQVFLFGAGHVGRALVMAMASLPFAITWIDPRPGAFPTHVPGNVTTSDDHDPGAVLAVAPGGSFVLAITHSHALDLAVVHGGLADPRFPYVGVIGSKTKRARFVKRLGQAGIATARIAELVCPIGIDGIRGKAPAVIAAATAAQLILRDEALRGAAVPTPLLAEFASG